MELKKGATLSLPKGYKNTEIGVIPDEWEVKKLGSIGMFSKGQGIRKDQSNSGSIPCVRYGELYTRHNDFVKEFYSYISEEVAQTSYKLKIGDILFAGSGETKAEIGKSVAFTKNIVAYAGGDIVILSPKSNNSLFLGFLLNDISIQQQKASRGQGDAVVHISATQLKQIQIPLPPLPEQTAIATVLSDTDSLIQALEKKIAKKQLIKKGAMQELLSPKEGWVVKTLGEIGEVQMCKRILKSETKKNDLIPFYKIGTFGKEADAYISKELYNNYRQRFSFPKKGEILISASGTIGRTIVYNGKPSYFQDSNIVWIDNDKKLVSNKFLYFVLQVINYDSEGSTIQRLYNSIIKSAKFNLPCSKEEQTQIAQILSDMDAEIEALEKKLAKYKELKQGLMQVLLTGKIRLV